MKPLCARRLVNVLAAAIIVVTCGQPAAAQTATDPCSSLVPAAIGGPSLPADRNVVELRWLGTANYELDYRGHVYLLDTYYDRKPRDRPIGFKAAQVKRADVIFLGHGHFDHMADAVPVQAQTKAPVVGAPITIETAVKFGLPAGVATTVRGGETLHFGDLTVDTALAQHSNADPRVPPLTAQLYDVEMGPLSPEELTAQNAVMARGTFSPDVITKGTIAFVFTLSSGYKILWLDSAGPITEGDRELAKRVGPVDVAIIAYQAHPVAAKAVEETLPLVRLFRPRIYLPAHHDESYGTWLDLGVEPLFMAMRDEMPSVRTIAPLYRTPICLPAVPLRSNAAK
jgi:L-ascorbate metabolism protein UlaG (beta-lactamase superfamily)